VISLSFDDALNEHLDFAWPVLQQHGLRGTFYANLNASALATRINQWREVTEQGHELGNHTIFHPATAAKKWVREGNALELYTPDRIRMEMEVANQWLQTIDGKTQRTFAFPCSNTIVGKEGITSRFLRILNLGDRKPGRLARQWKLDPGNTQVQYASIALENCFACRGGGLHLHQISPSIASLKRDYLPSAAVDNHSCTEMKSFVTNSLNNGGWPILQFHGVGGGHRLDCNLKEFTKFIEWLGHEHRESVLTVLEGAQKLFT
jgi:sialate O-acetylesterase